jgi:hypothetical protein
MATSKTFPHNVAIEHQIFPNKMLSQAPFFGHQGCEISPKKKKSLVGPFHLWLVMILGP